VKRSGLSVILDVPYIVYCAVSFTALGLAVLGTNLFLPTLRQRRVVAGAVSRAFLWIAGIPFKVEGLDRLPASPCVVVANHASYIDAIAIAAAISASLMFSLLMVISGLTA